MKRILYLIITVFATLSLVGCHRDHEPEEPPARRTVLVYMVAKNSLSGFDTSDIGEMLQADIPADCRLLVFRASRSTTAPQLLEITGGQLKALKTYPESTIGADAETLIQVLADARQLVKSTQWGLVFWSHSTGWKGAVKAPSASRSFGQETGGYEIELPDLAAALHTAPPFEFLFFDSCYMGGVEVAYELRGCADYLVASPCEVPVTGMPYDDTLPCLFNSNTPLGLSQAIDINVDYYISRINERCPSTMALIDLHKMNDLAAASAPVYANSHEPKLTPQQISVSSSYKDLFVDFEDFMRLSANSDVELGALRAALAETVIHERHSDFIWGSVPLLNVCGLTVNPQPYNPNYSYQNLSWYKDVVLPYGIED